MRVKAANALKGKRIRSHDVSVERGTPGIIIRTVKAEVEDSASKGLPLPGERCPPRDLTHMARGTSASGEDAALRKRKRAPSNAHPTTHATVQPATGRLAYTKSRQKMPLEMSQNMSGVTIETQPGPVDDSPDLGRVSYTSVLKARAILEARIHGREEVAPFFSSLLKRLDDVCMGVTLSRNNA